jgi:hypothetical protein
MGMDRLLGPWALCVSLMLGGAAIAEENPVLRELFEQGVPIPDGAPVKLAPPTLNDEMDPAAQMAAIKQVAQPNHTAQDLLRRSLPSRWTSRPLGRLGNRRSNRSISGSRPMGVGRSPIQASSCSRF